MDPFVTPGLGTIIGAGISGLGSFFGGRSQQAASAKMAREQMDFQERMSSTAHQREVQDLRAAGLNPILSARLGGSSSPSGAMGTAVNYIGDAARTGVSTALQANLQEAQLALLKEQTTKTAEEAENVRQDTNIKRLLQPNTQEQFNLIKSQSEMNRAETLNKQNMNRNIQAEFERIRAGTTLTQQQTATERMNTGRMHTQWAIFEENLTSAKSEAEHARIILDFLKSDAGRIAVQAGLFGTEGSKIVDPISKLKR